jgi:hypothetical protein
MKTYKFLHYEITSEQIYNYLMTVTLLVTSKYFCIWSYLTCKKYWPSDADAAEKGQFVFQDPAEAQYFMTNIKAKFPNYYAKLTNFLPCVKSETCVNKVAGPVWAEVIYQGVLLGHKSPIKNKTHWSVSERDMASCSKIYIEDINMDEINKRYIFSKLINLDIKFDLFKNNNDLKDKDCKIILDNGFFKILKH